VAETGKASHGHELLAGGDQAGLDAFDLTKPALLVSLG
jgi:hypothetical protein